MRTTPAPAPRPWLAALCVACATVTGGCALGPPYQPFDGGDAARLRVRLSYPAEYRSLLSPYRLHSAVDHRPLDGQSCGQPVGHPWLRPQVAPPPQAQHSSAAPPPPTLYPRAGMPGATAAEHSESLEVALKPGVHIVRYRMARAYGNVSTTQCDTALVLRLEPGRQYELVTGFNERGQCFWESRQLEGDRFVQARLVQRHGPAHQICDGGRYQPG